MMGNRRTAREPTIAISKIVGKSRFSKTMKFSRTPLSAHVWKETGKTVRRAQIQSKSRRFSIRLPMNRPHQPKR